MMKQKLSKEGVNMSDNKKMILLLAGVVILSVLAYIGSWLLI